MVGWVVALTPIVVAVIGGPTMWMLHRVEKKNDRDHQTTIGVLTEVRDDMREVKADVRELKADHRDLRRQQKELRDVVEGRVEA